MTRLLRLSAAAVLLPLLSSSLRAQGTEDATFYLIMGADTLIVERSSRTPVSLRFQAFDLKRNGRVDVEAQVDGNGLVPAGSTRFFTAARDTVPALEVGFRITADSVGIQRGAGTTNWVRVQPGTLPAMNASPALLEQALIRARAIGGTGSVTLPMIYLPSGPAAPATLTWIGADSATISVGAVVMRFAVSPTGRLVGGAIPSQNVRIVRDVGSSTAGLPRAKTYEAPAGAPYSAQDVTIRTPEGLSLGGTLTLPRAAAGSRVPVLITITGSGSQDRDATSPGQPAYRPFRQLADTLGRRGIAVLRLDDRGVGASSRGPSTVTTRDLADDIRAAVAFLRARPDVDGSRIGLLGHSEGSAIASMVASTDSLIRAVVFMAGYVSTGRELLGFQQRFVVDSMARLLGQQRDAALAQYARNTDSLATVNPWMKFFLDYDGVPAAGRIRAPVLIAHGAKDYQIPVSETEKTAAAIRAGGNRDVTIRIYPATNHLMVDDAGVGFSYERLPSLVVRPEVIGSIADWLVTHLTR